MGLSGGYTVTMAAAVSTGLAVSSDSSSTLATATFTNVQVTDSLTNFDIADGTPAQANPQYNAFTDTYDVRGFGSGITGASDGFHFASKDYTGE